MFSISGKHLASVNEVSNRSAQAYNKATLDALYAMSKELAAQYFKTDQTKARKFESFLERQMEKGLTFGFEVRRRERQGLIFSVELVVGEKQILKLIEQFYSTPATM